MTLFLGVDSGGTKTKFLLCNEVGQVQAQSIQPTSHYLQVGYAGVSLVMQRGLEDCLKQANANKEDIVSIFASCAGHGDIEKDTNLIEKAILDVFHPVNTKIGNDVENAFAGSLGGKPGINVIAGTGSIGIGRDDSQKTYRCGGWHHAFGGDEGSAYWIACRMILLYTRMSDGRDPKTELYHYLNKKYLLTTDSEILALTVQEWEFDRTKIASLAQDVYQLAILGDSYALQIYQDAAKELADIYLTIKRNLQFQTPISASYTGGVFRSQEFILSPLRALLAPHGILLVPPIMGPDGGSVILALQNANIKITDDIIKNLMNATE